MNELSQLENRLFSTQKDLDALKKNNDIKILVLSDSHGSKDLLLEIIKTFGQKVDALLFSGDGIYDLIYSLEKSKKTIGSAKYLPSVIGFVKGNNDPSTASSTFQKKIIVPSKIILKAGERTILVTHGHNEGVYYDFSNLTAISQAYGANAVIFGHTHVPTEIMGTTYVMNPGSITCPRYKSFKSFAILEITGKNINSVFYKIDENSKNKFIPYFPETFYGF